MTYDSGASFRRALEDRLRVQSLQTGVPLVRLRKTVIFDRFLVRLMQDPPDAWVLKGGLALQLRLGNRAGTTKDIDVLLTAPYPDIHQALRSAVALDAREMLRYTNGSLPLLTSCSCITSCQTKPVTDLHVTLVRGPSRYEPSRLA